MPNPKPVRVAVGRANPDDPDSLCRLASWYDPPRNLEPLLTPVDSLADVWQFADLHDFPRANVEFVDGCESSLADDVDNGDGD